MKRNTMLTIAVIALVAIGIGYYFLGRNTTLVNAAPPDAPAEPVAKPPPVVDEPLPQYPVPKEEAVPPTATANSPESQPAPKDLDTSDEPLDRWLGDLIGQDRIDSLFGRSDLIRRFVKTVENSSEGRIPETITLFKPLADDFHVDSAVDGPVAGPTLSPSNYARYSSYVDLLTSVDAKKLISIYTKYYPLIQKASGEIGMNGYFNDRLVAALDNALDAPDVEGPIKLIHDGYYKFEDPKLEALSASQKALIRMGPANAARVKAKLRDFRQRLTHLKSLES